MFDEAFPYYLSIGMTYEQFWHGDVWLVEAYRKADEMVIERQNKMMHLQGIYNLKAYKVIMDNFAYGLGGCNGARPRDKYPEYPIPITEHEKELEHERAVEETRRWFMEGQN